MKKEIAMALAAAVAAACAGRAAAETIVDVTREGAEKMAVSVATGGSPEFKKCLERNLAISGAFVLATPGAAQIKVSGDAGGEVTVQGRGKAMTLASRAGDAAGLRKEARMLADKMCEAYAGRPGFASAPLAFVRKKGRAEELCTGYADGSDVRQLTSGGKACVGPRWRGPNALFYTGFHNNAPQVFEIDASTGRSKLKWGFGGLTACASVAPGGSTAALVISKPFGNPELCTIDLGGNTWRRLTNTPAANEGQPAWSPDGRKIAFVSDETRRQHLYVFDLASGAKKRITSTGTQNVDPDWGPSGKIAYITKRGGQASVAILDPATGDREGRLVTKPGKWEHPTWAPDGRHVAVEHEGILYLVDTEEDGDEPRKLFGIDGKCITPCWYRAPGGNAQ